MTFEDFKREINLKRKSGGKNGSWYTFAGTVDGKYIELKAYKTWIQIYRVDGINYSGLMDISVEKFNKTLEKPFNGV